jgi:hypothetical protein
MPRFFAVKGPPRTGKGRTVRNVCKKLLDAFPNAKKELFQPVRNRRDFRAVLNIDGTMIGIDSYNHGKDRTRKSLQLFQAKRCDVIVCATSTKGSTVQAVRNRFAEREITWLDLPKPKSKKTCRAKADEIFHEVCAIVK